MILLVLIAIAQLVVLVLILSIVGSHATQHQTDHNLAADRIRGIQRQTIEAMFAAAAEGRGDVVDGHGRDVQRA